MGGFQLFDVTASSHTMDTQFLGCPSKSCPPYWWPDSATAQACEGIKILKSEFLKFGQFLEGEWKRIKIWQILKRRLNWISMKIWQILTRRLTKYENLLILRRIFKSKKIWLILRGRFKSKKIWQNLTRRLKKCETLANYEKEIETIWRSGKFWRGDLKSKKILQILTWRLKKYVKMTNFR